MSVLFSKLWLVYSVFSFQTHIILKAEAVWIVMQWSLVDRCQCFGRICCLHLQVLRVPPEDHNLINDHDKVNFFTSSNCSLCLASSVATTLAISSSPALSLNGEHALSTTSGRGFWQNINSQLDHSKTNYFLYSCINLAILYTERE